MYVVGHPNRVAHRRVPKLVSPGAERQFSSGVGKSLHTWKKRNPATLVSKTPAQSVAMLEGTDGLPPELGINRFHASRRSLAHYPASTV
jgi:hypothetical protein